MYRTTEQHDPIEIEQLYRGLDAAAPPDLQKLTAAAYTTGSEAGFAEPLANYAVVTCLLRYKPLGDTLVSWTITHLPGTVFSDYTNEPAVFARDLIHEAGHNWLYPWRKTKRPAFGFLHACWSFEDPLTPEEIDLREGLQTQPHPNAAGTRRG
ncbi:hypothetical protein [Streptomyces sp. NPDC102282]|uniref:hypothetical protein n=1 Tax=Streptomyces sp. NPDC102282 TaxID=3366154 RepID=UPI003814E207